MRLRVAVLLVPLVVLGVAACGGSSRLSKATYNAKLNAAMTRLGERVAAAYRPVLPALGKPVPPTACAHISTRPVCTPSRRPILPAVRRRLASQVQSAASDAADTLAALKPPANVASDNAKLVEVLRSEFAPEMESLVSVDLGTTSETPRQLHTFRTLVALETDLARKGYDLRSGSFVFRQPVRPKSQQPRKAVPRPFSLVSRAGTQPATDLRAETEACRSTGTGVSCAVVGSFERSPGPLPNGLSVVRPEERIRFALPRGTGPAILHTPLASLYVSDLCNPDRVPPVVDTFLDHPSWSARLRPGAYNVTLSFSWQGRHGQIHETGIVGLLVSRTDRLRVLPKPRCA